MKYVTKLSIEYPLLIILFKPELSRLREDKNSTCSDSSNRDICDSISAEIIIIFPSFNFLDKALVKSLPVTIESSSTLHT